MEIDSPITPNPLLNTKLLEFSNPRVNELAPFDLKSGSFCPHLLTRGIVGNGAQLPNVNGDVLIHGGNHSLVAGNHIVNVPAIAVDAEAGRVAPFLPGYAKVSMVADACCIHPGGALGFSLDFVMSASGVCGNGSDAHVIWCLVNERLRLIRR